MSPLHINILLHYYSRVDDYARHADKSEPDHARSGAVREFLEEFVKEGLLTSRFGDISWACTASVNNQLDGPIFKITDKGMAMVDHLRAVQIPVCQWVQP